jgi:plasmid stabilization system protein ParE
VVRSTAAAARDLTGICDYIKEHDSPAAARRVALLIYRGVGALSQSLSGFGSSVVECRIICQK